MNPGRQGPESGRQAVEARYYASDRGFTWQPVPVGADGTATIGWTPDTTSTFLVVYSQTADGTQSEQYWYGVNVNG